MKWMKERDLLIAQTLAFVQSVTGKKPDADLQAAASSTFEVSDAFKPADGFEPVAAPIPDIAAVLAETSFVAAPPSVNAQPRPAQIARIDLREDFQSEIKARVANFRAHQQRFLREREAYCTDTMAKVRASIQELAEPPRLGK